MKIKCSVCQNEWAICNRTNAENYICPMCKRIDKKIQWLEIKRASRNKNKMQGSKKIKINKILAKNRNRVNI